MNEKPAKKQNRFIKALYELIIGDVEHKKIFMSNIGNYSGYNMNYQKILHEKIRNKQRK